MRFLVLAEPNFPIPPELAPNLMQGLIDWSKKYKASGKMQEVWGNSGQQGGGGILNVNTIEEAEDIMNEFPFFMFSKIKMIPISDLETIVTKRINLFNQAMNK